MDLFPCVGPLDFAPWFLSTHNFFPLEKAMFGGLQKKKIFFSAQLKRALKKNLKALTGQSFHKRADGNAFLLLFKAF